MTDLYLDPLTTVLNKPKDGRQLARAIAAHREYLRWVEVGTIAQRKRFIKFWLKVDFEEI